MATSLAHPGPPYHLCDPLRHLLCCAGGPATDRDLLVLADTLRQVCGAGALVGLALRGQRTRPAVIEGVRLRQEAVLLHLAGYTTIFVDTPAGVRRARMAITGFSPTVLDAEAETLRDLADIIVPGFGCGISVR